MQKGACKQRWRPVGCLVVSCLAFLPGYAGAQGIGLGGAASPGGASPGAGIIWGSDGVVYGTTRGGGDVSAGTIFSLNPDGSNFGLLHSFAGGAGGATPDCTLVQGWDGSWYGTTTRGGLGCGVVFNLSADGTVYTVLYTFTGRDGDGAYPAASLVLGGDGALYGTCHSGGAADVGTVFKLNTDGSGYQVLHSFNVLDGAWPRAALACGWDGAFYGTCYSGGSQNAGTIFKLNSDGSGFAVLHHFLNDGEDGAYPFSPLLQGWDWGFYGTTSSGGTNNAGIAFKLRYDAAEYTILHQFQRDGVDGSCPYTTLVQGADWGLYGATLQGGGSNLGTVFRMNIDGTGYGVLHSFGQNTNDGVMPYSVLVQGGDGKMYGTTLQGGSNNVGTVYRLNLDGTGYSVLHTFVADPGQEKSGSSTSLELPQLAAVTILPDKNFQVTLSGTAGLVWRVEAATSLVPPVAWQPVALLTNTNGMVQFTDLSATNYPQRFYRAVWP